MSELKQTYTREEVIQIISILEQNTNFLNAIRIGANSIKRWLFDFDNGKYDKYK